MKDFPHYTLMGWILETEGSINELFKTPGLTSAQFLLDWLHIVDIGIASDFLGNLFYYMVHHKMEGNNLSEKVCALFKKIQEYYKAEGIESKLPTLTLLMIRKKATQSPKLRAKAAEARGLILFAHKVCETYMEDSCVLEHGIKMAATELWRCLWLLEQKTLSNKPSYKPMQENFCFCARDWKIQNRKNMDDKAKTTTAFWKWLCRDPTLQILGHIAMKTLEDFSAT